MVDEVIYSLPTEIHNQLGDGWLEGEGGKLSRFGVEVVEEMNRWE
jgi:microsomal dipeptidase-like Zn-dependent dipeptidase